MYYNKLIIFTLPHKSLRLEDESVNIQMVATKSQAHQSIEEEKKKQNAIIQQLFNVNPTNSKISKEIFNSKNYL